MSDLPVSLDDVRSAAERLAGVANRTPVHTSRGLDERLGARLFFKCESFQRGGSFKFRGAYNAVSRLDEEQRRRGVASFSSGNHAQGLALACRLLGVPATIVMPHDAPPVKLEAARGYGAEIVPYHRLEQKREEVAREIAAQRGLAIVPPFDHPHLVAGQGTAAVELLEEGGLIDGKEYKGRRISLDFKDVEVADVLRLIAEVSDLNIIAGD